MKIGLLTDSLGALPLDEVLQESAALGVQSVEFACGNWSSAPHIQLDRMLDDSAHRANFLARLSDHGLAISALNCSGNQLHPGPSGKAHHQVVEKTIRLAALLEVERVVMMSGLPGGPGDANPNWITTDWPAECLSILDHQWQQVLIPYWQRLVEFANHQGIRKLCLELHGHQAVYHPASFWRLREAVGNTVGVNYDPSHPMWMAADPIAAVRALGDAIYHVHAKDTRIETVPAGIDGMLETRAASQVAQRSWNYVTLGYGHGEAWWKQFLAALHMSGYDDVLSIEHEDMAMSPLEGVRKSVRLLQNCAVNLKNQG
ncbi:sugar phosphate isomerase/epimerase family protein [Verminephrobacter eiseniae]|uniref:sugar phosphate isomerase/epimerase family protein n=1 Tax=Verminephrobacter eiseniae TaxID=364317 RepID=UPI0010DDBAD6|nr:sugar phosphate isomerase/epimerase [Verminephrobacter eiseniae]KAB7575747.1 sugar phosphate isomerase/epimerase [Verminephrobacter sp. Larva24]MCW5232890.1 sugar phosphate isomerase/epimerase [Verminephrobacter eiseniae]MCW5295557.1 sugar phosphate isomerase/epimerase [Verminephrobacter eiseniae]MCW8184482.1 sugar phosphate isomerase/epimerase [Verminephrobacter eiseniae]MCW8223454.1 sugar phosphate isomerase/epimerase [Verminephrobacter eiseniae]